ncbi:MAG: uracil-DNA glycosylase [Proteobacteria bacterium]|nr:uracil-DNA glycosylase [Pseudomonadota bacterium]
MGTEAETYGLLKFYLEAGVDETIGLKPVNRFERVPKPTSSSKPVELPRKTVKTEQFPSLSDGIAAAEKAAGGATNLEELRAAIEKFDGCALKQMATTTVYASGNASAKLMILDRQPSVDEDRSGQPFSGDAGALLAKMLAAIGLTQDDVYLTSVLPWRPPGGRKATKEELALCLPFVRRHIALQGPEIILACGEAASVILGQNTSINRLRGKWSEVPIGEDSFAVLPIFHPGFLLDHPSSKKYAWADLQALNAKLRNTG